mmetsp:Transcript_8714/g.18770  ORF Transcript_8714/g.18770 Transcript_8714/m.18770 type:complete len:175 (-) Transcript_8714:481-1005(-)
MNRRHHPVKLSAKADCSVHTGHEPKQPQAHSIASSRSGEANQKSHVPSGQYLSVDVRNVVPDLLGSAPRIIDAVDVMLSHQALSAMRSYRCRTLVAFEGGEAASVACAGVLLGGGHLAVHAWPARGAMSLDLFVAHDDENVDLVSMLPLLEQLFVDPKSAFENATANRMEPKIT